MPSAALVGRHAKPVHKKTSAPRVGAPQLVPAQQLQAIHELLQPGMHTVGSHITHHRYSCCYEEAYCSLFPQGNLFRQQSGWKNAERNHADTSHFLTCNNNGRRSRASGDRRNASTSCKDATSSANHWKAVLVSDESHTDPPALDRHTSNCIASTTVGLLTAEP